jgi:opacity protein-like surface antigen
MRNVVRILLTSALMLILAGSAFAELNMEAKSFYGQGIISLPTGDLGDFAGTGFGGGIGMEVPYSELMNFRAEIGYIMFGKKDFMHAEYSMAMIPVVALAQYRMKVEDPYFLLGGAGITSVRSSYDTEPVEYLGVVISDGGSFDTTSSEFTITLGGGYDVNEQVAIEGRYHIISNSSYMSVHGTYSF